MMRSVIGGLAAAVLLSCSFSAAAELKIYKDYVPSKDVWNVTFVRVAPNRIDEYLAGIRQTWFGSCDAGKKAGVVVDCSVFVSETTANRDFNVMLVIRAPSAAVSDPDQKRYESIMADVRAKLAEDKQKQLVQSYDEIRTFFGEQSFRRLEFK